MLEVHDFLDESDKTSFSIFVAILYLKLLYISTMFYLPKPSPHKPWPLSKSNEVPAEVAKLLDNYHLASIHFLFHNFRKGIKGSILNVEQDMNLPLQLSAFFSAVVKGPAVILLICSRQNIAFWHYHLTNHAKFEVIPVNAKNSKDCYQNDDRKVALIVPSDCLNLCEDLDHNFFSVVIEDLDQIATKRIIKKLSGSFNVGLTHRSFYARPDQKTQWSMLNWANPGCVGKLKDFYQIDNANVDTYQDNYRYWWLRLTWAFCESFTRPSSEQTASYNEAVRAWAADNNLNFPPRQCRKRKQSKVPSEKVLPSEYVKLPSMDEDPIVTSIIRKLEESPEPIRMHRSDESSVIFSFLEDQLPSTSRTRSEDFILSLINEEKSVEDRQISDILKEADALLQN